MINTLAQYLSSSIHLATLRLDTDQSDYSNLNLSKPI